MKCENMEYDVVIVGAGPSGLSAAIKIMQLSKENKLPLKVCVIEKGSEVGAHILSGAVIETRSLEELLPNWKDLDVPLKTQVSEDHFVYLTSNSGFRVPSPPQMQNEGNYIISLGNMCRWLASHAESLGIEIYSGFPASDFVFYEDGSVKGILTGDMGVGKDGEKTQNYQSGIEIFAKMIILAEGCRGSLTKIIMEKFDLKKDSNPQTYGIGIKELWEIDPKKSKAGKIIHTIGWPLDNATYGGSWIYHLDKNLLSVGFVVGLDYENPFLSPYDEFQRFKTHPLVKGVFENGKRISYGARALSEGGFQSLPKLIFPGGLLIGDTAGFLNVPKLKGTHTAMKSGILAGESVFKGFQDKVFSNTKGILLERYPDMLKESWLWKELRKERNIRPAFRWGRFLGLIYSALETYIFRGRSPWTLNNHADHRSLKLAKRFKKIKYPKYDGKITFDMLSSVYLSNTNHEENQPSHLQILDQKIPIENNLNLYDSPEQRYCPAGVYEILRDEEGNNPYLQINAQNCVHCKTCDIKDPEQNINWVPPEGGGGPNYSEM